MGKAVGRGLASAAVDGVQPMWTGPTRRDTSLTLYSHHFPSLHSRFARFNNIRYGINISRINPGCHRCVCMTTFVGLSSAYIRHTRL